VNKDLKGRKDLKVNKDLKGRKDLKVNKDLKGRKETPLPTNGTAPLFAFSFQTVLGVTTST